MQTPTLLDLETLTLLEQDLPKSGVLSVVLDVNPASPLNQGGSLHARAKHLMAALGAADAADALVQAVLDDLEGAQRTTRTRAYFVWDEHRHVKSRLVDSQLEIPENAEYGAPDLEPLRFSLDSSPRTLIALVDREWGRIFKVHLGSISELRRMENVLERGDAGFREHSPHGPVVADLSDTDPHQDSGRPALSRDSDNDRVAGREAHQDLKFNKTFVEQLAGLHQSGTFERLIIAGPIEARSSLKAELIPRLESMLLGEFAVAGDASAAHVLETAREVLEAAEAAFEQELMNQVREHGVRGADETLRALQEGRIYQLLVAGDGSSLPIWRDSDGYVFAVYPEQGASPLTGDPVEAHTLREVLPELREKYGVRVQFLRGSSAETLEFEMRGLAGMARY